MATGADALPYPDDDPAAIRGFARALGGRSEAVSGAIGTVRGGRDALAARWQGAAGPAAVAEVDAVAALGAVRAGLRRCLTPAHGSVVLAVTPPLPPDG